MSGFSYYKVKWGAEVVDCRSVQLFHQGSLLFFKALAGELRRELERRLGGPARVADGNVAKHESEARAEEPDEGEEELPGADRRFVDALLSSLATKQVRITNAAEIDSLFGLGRCRRPPPRGRHERRHPAAAVPRRGPAEVRGQPPPALPRREPARAGRRQRHQGDARLRPGGRRRPRVPGDPAVPGAPDLGELADRPLRPGGPALAGRGARAVREEVRQHRSRAC
jgi:hypothetical protein